MKATVLVTGATGFIGSVLVSYLKEQACNVRIFLRPESDREKAARLGVDVVTGRYDNPADLRHALQGVDMVIHLAGVTKSLDEKGFYEGNVMPVEEMLKTVVETCPGLRRFVLVSSLAAAGPARSASPGVKEHDMPLPVSAYGRSKLEAEQVALRWKDRVALTIVRPPAVYGPGDKDVLQFFSALKKRVMLAAGDGRSQRFSLIYVDDLVKGIVLAATAPDACGETYFLTSSRGYSWAEVARVAQKALGIGWHVTLPLPKSVIRAVAAVSGAAGRITGRPSLLNPDKAEEMVQDFWVCSPLKAQRELGFSADTTLQDGVKATIEWYRKEGWL